MTLTFSRYPFFLTSASAACEEDAIWGCFIADNISDIAERLHH